MTELETLQRQIKDNIATMISQGKLSEAKRLLSEYKVMVSQDGEIFSIEGLIAFHEGQLGVAKSLFQHGLVLNAQDFDLQYNLAYVHEAAQEQTEAIAIYQALAVGQCTPEQQQQVRAALERLRDFIVPAGKDQIVDKKKLAFFVKQGMDSFLGDIINELSGTYEIKKIVVTQTSQIDEGMQWADICWFEWCDELVIYASHLPIAADKQVVCRLHRYEVFTDYPVKVAWKHVDTLIIVTKHLQKFLENQIADIAKQVHIVTIENGVNLKKFSLQPRQPGFKLAYVGYIHSRKNPVLLLQIMYELVKRDKRYTLYIAGQFQEPLVELYWNYQVQSMGLQKNILFQGWQAQVSDWLQDKNFLLSTSTHESFGYGIAEAMALGVKPIIHNFVFASEIWDKKYLFNSISEAVAMIADPHYDSREYRQFIERQYSLEKQLDSINKVLANDARTQENKEKPQNSVPEILLQVADKFKKKQNVKNLKHLKDITMIMTTYNRADVLRADLEQGYKFGSMPKLLVNDCSDAKNTEIIKNLSNKFGVYNIVHHSHNQGLAAGMSTCFKHCSTQYALSLDDDDMLFCLDEEQFIHDMNQIKQTEVALVIPRYIINLHEDMTLMIQYDRKQFDNMLCNDVLCSFMLTGEIQAFHAGSIYHAKEMYSYSAESFFRVGEDYVRLSRLFGNNSRKKVFVSESYVHVRRMNTSSLSGKPDEQKLAVHLLSMLVSGYYCFKNELLSVTQVVSAIRNRGILLQKSYGFGADFAEAIVLYFQGVQGLDFAGELLEYDFQTQSVSPEFVDILEYINRDQAAIMHKFLLPKVSIIIPTFNRKESFQQALESAMMQDYGNLEIVVSDNASTDGTDELIKTYLQDPRIRYYRNETNIGFVANHRQGLYELASGEYALMMHDDDYLTDNRYVTKAVELFLENPSVLLVHANCINLDVNRNLPEKTNHKTARVTRGLDYFVNYEQPGYAHIVGMLTSVFCRKKAMDMGCFYEKTLAVDLLLYLKMMLSGDVGVIEDHVAIYRHHGGSCSNNLIPELDYSTITELEKIYEMALNRGLTWKVMRNWLTFRIFKYVRWTFLSYYQNGKPDIGLEFLNSIRTKYPEAYHAVRQNLGPTLEDLNGGTVQANKQENIARRTSNASKSVLKDINPAQETAMHEISLPEDGDAQVVREFGQASLCLTVVVLAKDKTVALQNLLDDILNQIYTNLEVILYDQSGQEGMEEFVEDFLLDTRVTYQRDSSLQKARENNLAALIALGHGDYVCIAENGVSFSDESYLMQIVTKLATSPKQIEGFYKKVKSHSLV